ncbi:carboxypeptidase regulatory-like domain-containing protein [Olleya sp. YSTF-M6]|uniref:Carboxypeptidase regulatory-like domain-containing protein n=1 Tax=Olleya sediminilitoris TaxID=2795739 RepID=A0ABS1WK09_9FLAO|nr:carboxypeptidase regulatory-like domain-containing protein [Olleya sediminilitoris]MBL7559465.1 carboxypeptidase regulatory-like domain-containing protein [Olleya sediminilitoris]
MKTLNQHFKFILSLMVTLGMLLTSCNPNESVDIPETPENNPTSSQLDLGSNIQRDFMGRIVDQSSVPLDNVSITIGNKTATTDNNGMFKISDVQVKQRQAFILAEKPGFLNGMRSVVPTQGTNMINIMMITENLAGTVTSGVTSEVSLPNGTKVGFDGSFKDQNGNAYSGNVDVYMYHLDPANPDNNILMPGSLQAVNQDGDERVLESYGMLNVELKGDSGQKLNIADGHIATIEMPMDPAQSGVAPSVIPLWHFDEVNGYWVEDGEATLVSGKYIGEVSHFSWWNCDAQFPTVDLCMTVVDASNIPLSNVKVELWRSGQTYPRIGFSNGNGEICGLIPANETLTLKAIDQCGIEVYNTTIGPFNSDTNYGDVVMSSVNYSAVTGNLVDCSSQPVTNGYVTVHYGQEYASVEVVNGSFTLNMIECASITEFTLEGVNYDTFQTTTPLPFNFTTPNVGNIIACDTVTEYISVQIDNDPVDYYLLNLTAQEGDNGTSMYISTQNSTGSFVVYGNTTTLGTYTSSGSQAFYVETGINMDFGQPNTLQFTLSNYGAVNDYIDMNISGTFTDNDGILRNLSASIHVLRDM